MLGISYLIFLAFPKLIRTIDITSAPIDPGILSAVFVAILAVLTFKSLTWLLIRSIWPDFAAYAQVDLVTDFLHLERHHRVIVFMAFYLILLLSFVITLAALV